jgi:hypothetical protein
MLAIVEAMFGMFYMALLIARLVSLYSSNSLLETVNGDKIANKQRIGFEHTQTSTNHPND